MNIWLSSDSHFGHDNMVQYCGRPKDFSQRIAKSLFENCKFGDILVHLGDVCFGSDELWHNRYVLPLPCKKWLVRGNHDKKSNSWYLSHGWDFVCEQFSDTLFGKKILFSHIPQKLSDGFDFNIHGHLHNNLERLKRKEWVTPNEEERNKGVVDILTPKHKLVAMEYTNYQPVDLRKFLNI